MTNANQPANQPAPIGAVNRSTRLRVSDEMLEALAELAQEAHWHDQWLESLHLQLL